MNLQTKKLISLSIVIITLILIIIYIKNNIEAFKELKIISPLSLVILIILFFIMAFFTSLQTKVMLKPLNVKLTHKIAYGITMITSFYNLITPLKGGMGVRAVYLKRKYSFPYTTFLSALSATYVITFLTSSIAGMIATYLIYLNNNIFSKYIFLVFLGVFIGMIILIFFPNVKETKSNFINRFIRVINGWNLIKKNKSLLINATIIIFIQLLLSTLMLYLQFRVFGLEIDFIKSLFISSMGSIGILIAMTPAGFGISEAVAIFTAYTIGITPVESLPVILLGRAISIIVLFILGPILSYKMLRK